MVKEQKDHYVSPEVTTLEIKIQAIICQSGDTEKFGMSGNSYDDEAWK